jgi:hypothetical protein
VHQGIIVVQVGIGPKLLHDAINAIPDFGFARNSDQLRKAFQNDVAALQKMIDSGAVQGALQKLTQDFRPKVQRWVIDGYIKATPVQLEKPEVLAVIDKVTEQIRSSAR